ANMVQVLDTADNVEVLRRISGFLTIVQEVLRPLVGMFRTRTNIVGVSQHTLENPEEFTELLDVEVDGEDDLTRIALTEPVVDEGSLIAEHTIQLVVQHVACHDAYYQRAYLRSIFDATDGLSFREMLTAVITGSATTPAEAAVILDRLDWSSAYLEDDRYVVEFREPFTDDLAALLGETAEGLDVPIGTLDPLHEPFVDNFEAVEVPGGTHIEPFPGHCVLPDVPSTSGTMAAEISIAGC